MNITTEQGKTLKDAFNDVLRGLGWYTFLSCFSVSFLISMILLNVAKRIPII